MQFKKQKKTFLCPTKKNKTKHCLGSAYNVLDILHARHNTTYFLVEDTEFREITQIVQLHY